MWQHEQDSEYDDGQDEVHDRPCGEDYEPLGNTLACKALRVGRVLLSDHSDEPAQGYQVDGVDSAPVRDAEYAGRKSEAELCNLDAEHLGGREVSELVYEYEEREDGYDEEPARKVEHGYPPTNSLTPCAAHLAAARACSGVGSSTV